MSELLRIFEFTAQQAKQISSVQSVTDAPIVLDGVTVIPVSKLSCGFAGGGSDLLKNPSGVAAGAGVKVTKTPLSFLAVSGSEVQMLHVAEDADKKSIVESLTPLIAQFKDKLAAKKAKKAEESDAAESGAAQSVEKA